MGKYTYPKLAPGETLSGEVTAAYASQKHSIKGYPYYVACSGDDACEECAKSAPMDVLEIVFSDNRHFTLRGGGVEAATKAGLTPRYRGAANIKRMEVDGRTRYAVSVSAPAKRAAASKTPAKKAAADGSGEVAALGAQVAAMISALPSEKQLAVKTSVTDYIDMLGRARFMEMTPQEAQGIHAIVKNACQPPVEAEPEDDLPF